MKHSVIFDVDTGIDDAMALIFAVKHPDVDVRAITCVSGNTNVGQVVENTLKVLDLLDAPDIPVAAGAGRPLIEPARHAVSVHGTDGLANAILPASKRRPLPIHAVELLRRELLAATEPLTIVALAPLSNLALLLRTYPEVLDRIQRIVFMGGSATIGNATALAEFNIWHDPEAASVVLDSGRPLTMYGLDVFRRIRADDAMIAELTASAQPVQRIVGNLLGFETVGPTGVATINPVIGDAGAVCALVSPHLFTFQSWPLRVELAPGLCRGQTVVDRRARRGGDPTDQPRWPTADIAMNTDPEKVLALFYDIICAP